MGSDVTQCTARTSAGPASGSPCGEESCAGKAVQVSAAEWHQPLYHVGPAARQTGGAQGTRHWPGGKTPLQPRNSGAAPHSPLRVSIFSLSSRFWLSPGLSGGRVTAGPESAIAGSVWRDHLAVGEVCAAAAQRQVEAVCGPSPGRPRTPGRFAKRAVAQAPSTPSPGASRPACSLCLRLLG